MIRELKVSYPNGERVLAKIRPFGDHVDICVNGFEFLEGIEADWLRFQNGRILVRVHVSEYTETVKKIESLIEEIILTKMGIDDERKPVKTSSDSGRKPAANSGRSKKTNSSRDAERDQTE